VATSRYRIVLRGRLSERFESAFDGMTLEHGPNRTVLTGDVRDQAQLYGLIDRLQEFGIELLAVEPADSSDGGLEPGRLPGSGGWSVAVQHLGLVLVPRAGRPVRVDDQGPAPAVDHDLVVEGAEQDAVLGRRRAAVGLHHRGVPGGSKFTRYENLSEPQSCRSSQFFCTAPTVEHSPSQREPRLSRAGVCILTCI